MDDLLSEQERICREHGVECVPPLAHMKVGMARNTAAGVFPIHGLRHPPTDDTTGWFIWAGEYSEEVDFFEPVHAGHLAELCPSAARFLALPPGWRFLTAPDHDDAWSDLALLKVR